MDKIAITVGFSTTGKFMSRVIRWVTGARCSHAWISFYDETLEMKMVMQAEWWGYEIRPWHRWISENILVAEFETDLDMSAPLRSMAKSIGKRYDWFSAGLSGIKRWVSKWISSKFTLRPSRTPKKLMCSEAVVRFLQEAGSPYVTDIDPETTSPGDLFKIIGKASAFKVVGVDND